METDVDVQYFSHLNGLTLGNNWGDLIRLLDACLVNGLSLPSVTNALIDDQGDLHLTFYANHNAMLFQIVELSDFNSVVVDGVTHDLNKKYRIKGIPASNQLILKGGIERVESASNVVISNLGSTKLASLGYEIVFRDENDVKRVYRAKNPTAQHPFIRVDESISDGVNSYNSSYAKSAMVGLLANMNHIDDYANPSVLQLPFDPANPSKNWKITGTGATVVRGWAKWYWAANFNFPRAATSENAPVESAVSWGRTFTLCGNHDAFYLQQCAGSAWERKTLSGAGVFNSALDNDVVPNWFLMTVIHNAQASATLGPANLGVVPLVDPPTFNPGRFLVPAYNLVSNSAHSYALHLCPDSASGVSALFPGTQTPALEIPFRDSATSNNLRGTLKHVCYAGKRITQNITTPIISGNSMFVSDCCHVILNSDFGGFYYYLGELD